MTKTAVAIRHVDFEDLGVFAAVLADRDYKVRYCDADSPCLRSLEPLGPDLLLVLGGPMGVYEEQAYPSLKCERDILAARLEMDRPTFGVCLGAQLVAAAMGAKVFPSGIKEIGFSPLSLTEAGRQGPLRHLAGTPVLHWHGDTFDLPEGAVRLASTNLCAHQAFARGVNVMGVQFHVEVDAAELERWLTGYAAELAGEAINPRRLRSEAVKVSPMLRKAAIAMFSEWLGKVIF